MLKFIHNLFKKNSTKEEEEEEEEGKEWSSEEGSTISDIDDDFERLFKLNREGLYGHKKERFNQRRG